MMIGEFVEKVVAFAKADVGPNASQFQTRALLRVLETDVGKTILTKQVSGFVGLVTGGDGEIDVSSLRVLATAAIGNEEYPVMGIINVRAEDVVRFFDSLQA